jgi:hypothetical protein
MILGYMLLQRPDVSDIFLILIYTPYRKNLNTLATCMLGVDLHGQLDGVCMDSTATCMQGVDSHGQLDGACMHRLRRLLCAAGLAHFVRIHVE